MVDALGNPFAFFLTGGQAHDLETADALLPQMKADTLLADKAFDADERVIEPLWAAGKTPVIPSKSNRKTPRDFDREMYKARHVIESFICKIKQFRAIATRYDKTARNFLAGIQLVASVILLNCFNLAFTHGVLLPATVEATGERAHSWSADSGRQGSEV